MAVVWFQCATCCEAGWRRFLGRRARTPPPTCRAFATPWRFRIWRHVGTTGSDGRAVSSTSTRTPPPSPRYVHRIIPSSGRSSRRDPSPFLRFSLSYERDARETRSSFDSSFTNCINSASRFSFEPFNETRSMFRFIVCNFWLRLFVSMFSYCL